MKKLLSNKNRMLTMFIAISLIFVTTAEGFANDAGTGEVKNCEEQAQIIENVISDKSVNKDVYQTKDAIIADGYSAEITIPKDGGDVIRLDNGEGQILKFSLPDAADETEGLLTENGTIIYNCNESFTIGVQPLTEVVGDEQIDSARALINISNANAPHEYNFDFKLQKGERLITAKEYLGDENTAFPVVADPTAWQITKCAGAIAWVIGSTVFAVAKITKIKKYIKTLGGMKKSASKLIGIVKKAKTIAKKHKTSTINVLRKTKYSKELWKGVGTTLVNFGAAVLGVDTVIDKCSF